MDINAKIWKILGMTWTDILQGDQEQNIQP
jgi:hypothetical protein